MMNVFEYKGFRPGVQTVTCQSTIPLLEFVAAQMAAAPMMLHESGRLNSLELLELGAVYLNDERCFSPVRLVKTGDQVRIHRVPRRFEMPVDLQSHIVAENEDTITVEKPVGLPVDATVDNAKENLLSFLGDLYGQRFYLTHSLATKSDGLLFIGKSHEAAERIRRAFTEGRVLRRYAVHVEAPVEVGDHRFSGGGVKIVASEERRAETNVISENHTVWQIEGEPLSVCYRLEVEFSNVRPKEVRSYLSSCGAPVLGDRALGSRYTLVDSCTQKSSLAFLPVSFFLSP